MQWQVADLILAHRIIHTYCSGKHYRDLNWDLVVDPWWLRSFNDQLIDNSIDQASKSCFVQFMRQLPIMLSNAFLLHLVILGWKLSGSSPFDVEIILSKCVIFPTSDDEVLKKKAESSLVFLVLSLEVDSREFVQTKIHISI